MCWRVATFSCFQGWVREWQQTWERPFLHPCWGTKEAAAKHTPSQAYSLKMELAQYIKSCVCLRQDVAFFDANRTGQLVNRLTADIQEFKSSFKLVISQVSDTFVVNVHSMWRFEAFNPRLCPQGLRSITQTVGCFVSLYFISPKLTGLTVIVLPCLVGTGALLGSFLRRLSRLAQEQVKPNTIIVVLCKLLSDCAFI